MGINGVNSNNYNYTYTQNNITKAENAKNESNAMTSEEFLKELKQDFPEMKIYTAHITNSNRKKFTGGGSGIYNVAVSKEYLDEVANDPKKREEFKQYLKDLKVAVDGAVRNAKTHNRDLFQQGSVIDDKGVGNSWSSMRILDMAVEEKRQSGMKSNSLFSSLDKNREQMKLQEEQREKKRVEQRELKRAEQKKSEEERLQQKYEEKIAEEQRRLEQIINQNGLNLKVNESSKNHSDDISSNINASNFNTEI